MRRPIDRISDYIERRRIMPGDSPHPGLFSNSYTPYLREIMDDLSPYSLIEHEVLMCAAQVAKTTAAENICLYYMDECPTAVLFVTGSEDLAFKWSTMRLEPMLASINFFEKMGPATNNPKSRRTGDKVFSKEYMGGALHIASAQSAGGIASMSKRILIRDEIDRAPIELSTGEGNWLDVSEARTNAWGDRKKIFDCSTPTDEDTSQIFRLYQLGDCRKYMVPCPKCKIAQELEISGDIEDPATREKRYYGLKQVTRGKKRSVVYVCRHCGYSIEESWKPWMVANGHWKATKESSKPTLVSRHLNALYSPSGMIDWATIWDKAIEARGGDMKSFTNLVLGLPFKEMGYRPNLKLIQPGLVGHYRPGDIPGRTIDGRWVGPLFLTIGVDVQRGDDAPDFSKPLTCPRLEMELLGHGEDYRTWSILYKRFIGSVDDPFAESSAWQAMYRWMTNPDPSVHKLQSLHWQRSDGLVYSVMKVLVDSGYNAEIVYQWCRQHPQLFFPVKGIGWVPPEKRVLKGDVPGPGNYTHYKPTDVPGLILYEVSTNHYKGDLYARLHVPRARADQPPNARFCDFPDDPMYDDDYFQQLTAEVRHKDGSYHGRGRNEALDVRVYGMAAGEIYVREQLKFWKAEASKGNRYTPQSIEAFSERDLLRLWAIAQAKKA